MKTYSRWMIYLILGCLILGYFTPPLLSSKLFLTLTSLAWGYIFGSATGGPLFAKIFNLGDLKKIGSGNIGTTNVLRTGHKTAAILTLLFDGLKAVAAMATIVLIIPIHLFKEAVLFTAYGAFLGHLFPLWSNFSGGKGIATLAGISLMVSWPLGLALIGIWVTTALITRYSSLAGITSVLLAVPLSCSMEYKTLMYFFTAVGPLVLWRHKDNIHRLIEGRETKIGSRSKSLPHSPE